MHSPEEDQTSDRNVEEVQFVYNTLSHTYVHLLILIPYPLKALYSLQESHCTTCKQNDFTAPLNVPS